MLHSEHLGIERIQRRLQRIESDAILESTDEEELRELVNRIVRHDQDALAELFDRNRERLRRIIMFRMDARLRGRVDADDILQEAYMNASTRVDAFLSDAPRSVFIWLRVIINQTLIDVHRRHITTKKRSARREVSINSGWSADDTSFSLSSHLLGHLTSPSKAAVRAELSEQLTSALDSLSELDREVLALRHFEELTNSETAQVLSLSEQAASARYIRALSRLKAVLSTIMATGEG